MSDSSNAGRVTAFVAAIQDIQIAILEMMAHGNTAAVKKRLSSPAGRLAPLCLAWALELASQQGVIGGAKAVVSAVAGFGTGVLAGVLSEAVKALQKVE